VTKISLPVAIQEAGEPLPPDWALQVPSDCVGVLKTAVPKAVAKAGIGADEVVGIGTDFTACMSVRCAEPSCAVVRAVLRNVWRFDRYRPRRPQRSHDPSQGGWFSHVPLVDLTRGRYAGRMLSSLDEALGNEVSMSTMSIRRLLRLVISLLVAGFGVLAVPNTAGAAVQTFHRFEVVATANYTVDEQCADGRTSTTFVTVIGGHEEESEDGVGTLDSDFLTVRIRNSFDCEGNFINDFGTGLADFTFSPSLQAASVDGTITTRDGRSVTVDMSWEGTGPLETTSNTTTFRGFTGLFVGQQRDAVATGTVVVDDDTLIAGSTTNADIETLEDNNISHP
jgi:hypothetical protein